VSLFCNTTTSDKNIPTCVVAVSQSEGSTDYKRGQRMAAGHTCHAHSVELNVVSSCRHTVSLLFEVVDYVKIQRKTKP